MAKIAYRRKGVSNFEDSARTFQLPPVSGVARIIVGLSLLLSGFYIVLFVLHPLLSADIWFHIKAGEWIVKHQAVPRTDPFSFMSGGKEWLVNAWLSDVLFYLAWLVGGLPGVTVFYVLLILGMTGLLYNTLRRFGLDPVLSVISTNVFIFTASHRWAERPEVFSWIFLILFLRILGEARTGKSNRLWYLPLLTLLWANLHLGFILGPVLIAAFFIGAVLIPEKKHEFAQAKQLGLVLLATVVASLINPYHYKAWLFTLKLTALFQLIDEWKPLFEPKPPVAPAVIIAVSVLLLLALLTLLKSVKRQPDVAGAIILAGLSYQTATQRRMIVYLALTAVIFLAMHHPVVGWNWFQKRGWALCPLLPVVGIILLTVFGIPMPLSVHPLALGMDRHQYDDSLIRFVKETHPPDGIPRKGVPLFNTLEQGGFLLWGLYPEYKVYIDGRVDMYGSEHFQAYWNVLNGYDLSPLDDRQINCCVVRYPSAFTKDVTMSLVHHLSMSTEWSLVYYDDTLMLFVRNIPQNNRYLDSYAIRFLNPFADAPGPADGVKAEINRMLKWSPYSTTLRGVIGEKYMELNEPKLALEQFKLSRLTMKRDDFRRHMLAEYSIARAFDKLMDAEQTEAHARKALALLNKISESEREPADEAGALSVLGRSLRIQGKAEDAVKYLERAQELNPDDLWAQAELAEAYAVTGNHAKAVEILDMLVASQPALVRERCRLAEELARVGRRDEAEEHLREAEKLDLGQAEESRKRINK